MNNENEDAFEIVQDIDSSSPLPAPRVNVTVATTQ